MEHTDLNRRRAAPAAGSNASSKGPALNITMRASDIPSVASPTAVSGNPSIAAVVAGNKPTAAGVPLGDKFWVPDEDVAQCSARECRQAFTLFNRKHHCRTCANIFCANCSSRVIIGDDGGQLRVCQNCYYRHQLVILATRPNGQERRKCRGELKLLTRRVLVQILCFLDLSSVAKTALVSSDLYFAARDNLLWEVQFAARFATAQQPSPTAASATLSLSLRQSTMSAIGGAASPQPQPVASAAAVPSSPVPARHVVAPAVGFVTLPATTVHRRTGSTDATLTKSTSFSAGSAAAPPPPLAIVAAQRETPRSNLPAAGVATFHNYSTFSVFVKHLATDRCEGLATYAARARQLLMVGPRITVIGSSGAGKTMLIRKFVGDVSSIATAGTATVGIRAYEKRVAITGTVSTTTNVVLYEVSGEARFDSLRVMCASNSHGVVACYDPDSRDSFEGAQRQLRAIEARLPNKPVVVACGISRAGSENYVRPLRTGVNDSVSVKEAESISPNCAASLQVTLAQSANVIEAAVQAVVDRLYDRGAILLPHPTPLDVILNQA